MFKGTRDVLYFRATSGPRAHIQKIGRRVPDVTQSYPSDATAVGPLHGPELHVPHKLGHITARLTRQIAGCLVSMKPKSGRQGQTRVLARRAVRNAA